MPTLLVPTDSQVSQNEPREVGDSAVAVRHAFLVPRLLVPVDARLLQTEPRGVDNSVVAVRHAFLVPRLLVPADARLSQTEPRGVDDSVVAVRHAFLVPRLLVPAGARLFQTEPSGVDHSAVGVWHPPLVPRLLVPADARLSQTEPSGVSHLLNAVRQDLFKESLLDKVWAGNPVDWLISLGIHLTIVVAVSIVSLFFTPAIDLSDFENTTLVVSPSPGLPPLSGLPSVRGLPPPPPPPAAAAAHPQQRLRKPVLMLTRLIAPVAIPKSGEMSHGALEAPSIGDLGVPGGVVGGVPGGQIGGVLGGVVGGVVGGTLGGTGLGAPPPPPHPPAPAPSEPLRVGGEVRAPIAIFKPPPEYPPLALNARIEGDVTIDAVIDKNGNVSQAHVVDGPALLIAAALEAVKQWKYQPTYLNGVPWPVEMNLVVSFHLGASQE